MPNPPTLEHIADLVVRVATPAVVSSSRRVIGIAGGEVLGPRIRGKVLMAVGLMDKICPPSTQFAAFNKIVAPKELAIYPDHAHEGLPGWSDRVFQFMLEMAAPAAKSKKNLAKARSNPRKVNRRKA